MMIAWQYIRTWLRFIHYNYGHNNKLILHQSVYCDINSCFHGAEITTCKFSVLTLSRSVFFVNIIILINHPDKITLDVIDAVQTIHHLKKSGSYYNSYNSQTCHTNTNPSWWSMAGGTDTAGTAIALPPFLLYDLWSLTVHCTNPFVIM